LKIQTIVCIFVSNAIAMKKYNIPDQDPAIASDFMGTTYVSGGDAAYDIDHIQLARDGVALSDVLSYADSLGLSHQELSEVLHISLRTLQRYQPSKVLDTDLSAKALRLHSLYEHGIRVFGEESALQQWLRSSVPALEGHTPISLLDTPFGFDWIDRVLGRIEHGVFA